MASAGIAPELKGKPQVFNLQRVMVCDERIAFNVGRTFLSDHFAGRNTRVTLFRSKQLKLRMDVANLGGKQNIKMAFPQFAELWKLIDYIRIT